jgi:hypothetical protein
MMRPRAIACACASSPLRLSEIAFSARQRRRLHEPQGFRRLNKEEGLQVRKRAGRKRPKDLGRRFRGQRGLTGAGRRTFSLITSRVGGGSESYALSTTSPASVWRWWLTPRSGGDPRPSYRPLPGRPTSHKALPQDTHSDWRSIGAKKTTAISESSPQLPSRILNICYPAS